MPGNTCWKQCMCCTDFTAQPQWILFRTCDRNVGWCSLVPGSPMRGGQIQVPVPKGVVTLSNRRIAVAGGAHAYSASKASHPGMLDQHSSDHTTFAIL